MSVGQPIAIPPAPPRPGQNATPEERLAYQEAMQNRHFAIQMELNRITQEGAMKSNLQKAAHDALMAMINNLR
ncbi:MAG: hypothetical protein NZ585_11025 [Chloracidobacterium sp.]|nr:hypothetical protein [Chloracidobacterium sp.]MDW8218297.1 hypothetical protein [Acidobacteriota bacterium]